MSRCCNLGELAYEIFICVDPPQPRTSEFRNLPLAHVQKQMELRSKFPFVPVAIEGLSCKFAVHVAQLPGSDRDISEIATVTDGLIKLYKALTHSEAKLVMQAARVMFGCHQQCEFGQVASSGSFGL